jgi:hypothetical protein
MQVMINGDATDIKLKVLTLEALCSLLQVPTESTVITWAHPSKREGGRLGPYTSPVRPCEGMVVSVMVLKKGGSYVGR